MNDKKQQMHEVVQLYTLAVRFAEALTISYFSGGQGGAELPNERDISELLECSFNAFKRLGIKANNQMLAEVQTEDFEQ